MAAIRVAHAPGAVVVLREEQGRERCIRCVRAKKLVDCLQEAFGRVDGGRALAAQIGLQVRHQQRRRDSLPRNIADHQSKALAAKIHVVVIIPADLSSLDADARVIQSLERRLRLREEPRLDLFRNLQLLCSAALGLQLLFPPAPLGVDLTRNLVESYQLKRIAVEIAETCKYAAPNRFRYVRRRPLVIVDLDAPQPRRMRKTHAALAPLPVLRGDIVGQQNDTSGSTNEIIPGRVRLRRQQPKNGAAVGRRYSNPAIPRLRLRVKCQNEPKLVEIKPQRFIVIANIDIDRMKPKVRIGSILRGDTQAVIIKRPKRTQDATVLKTDDLTNPRPIRSKPGTIAKMPDRSEKDWAARFDPPQADSHLSLEGLAARENL